MEGWLYNAEHPEGRGLISYEDAVRHDDEMTEQQEICKKCLDVLL